MSSYRNTKSIGSQYAKRQQQQQQHLLFFTIDKIKVRTQPAVSNS